MKTNAPKKLYLIQDNGLICYCRNNKDDIEYIHIDAFIEKATSYIQQHWIWNTKMIKDFKKYMEG